VLDNSELGTIEDGTAIGNALATCLNRLRNSKAKSKVIVLVTDGVNNRGEVQPLDAANIAQALGVKIYTIGVGSSGTARVPVNDPVYGKIYADLQVEIDEASLRQIAQTTKGLYYRATDTPSLEMIFEEIGRLEKTKIKVKTYTHYNERFPDFLIPALALVFLGTLAGFTRFLKIPCLVPLVGFPSPAKKAGADCEPASRIPIDGAVQPWESYSESSVPCGIFAVRNSRGRPSAVGRETRNRSSARG
jgi:Ca-activated chloride channel family protein